MLRIEITNTGNEYHLSPNHYADYRVKVFINKEIIAGGFVKMHNRADGWRTLAIRAIQQSPDICENQE